MLKQKKLPTLVFMFLIGFGLAKAELILHLNGSVSGVDPNIVFKDLAKSNDALPINSTNPEEKGVGNVLDIYQSPFGAVGNTAMHFGPHETRAANIASDNPDFNRVFEQKTISLWYKPNFDSDTDTHSNYLVGKMGGSGQRGWRIERDDDSHQVKLMYFDGPSGTQHTYGMFLSQAQGVSSAEFTHIVATFEANTAVKFYSNGILTRTMSALSALNGANNAPLQIGNSGINGTRSADGIIDDLGIWDEVLSAQRVAAIYAMGFFENLNLQDARIDDFIEAFNSQNSINIGCNVWQYTTGLSTTIGTTGGSVAACNAYVVLDTNGSGMALSSCAETIQGDITGNCNVGLEDFAILASQWLQTNLP